MVTFLLGSAPLLTPFVIVVLLLRLVAICTEGEDIEVTYERPCCTYTEKGRGGYRHTHDRSMHTALSENRFRHTRVRVIECVLLRVVLTCTLAGSTSWYRLGGNADDMTLTRHETEQRERGEAEKERVSWVFSSTPPSLCLLTTHTHCTSRRLSHVVSVSCWPAAAADADEWSEKSQKGKFWKKFDCWEIQTRHKNRNMEHTKGGGEHSKYTMQFKDGEKWITFFSFFFLFFLPFSLFLEFTLAK